MIIALEAELKCDAKQGILIAPFIPYVLEGPFDTVSLGFSNIATRTRSFRVYDIGPWASGRIFTPSQIKVVPRDDIPPLGRLVVSRN